MDMRNIALLLTFQLCAFTQGRPSAPPQQPQTRGQGQGQQVQAPPATKPEDLATVQGQVVSSSGEALRKARVTLRRQDQAPSGAPRSYSATSDASGAFVFRGVEPGQYRLSSSRTGYVDTDYGSRDYLRSGS